MCLLGFHRPQWVLPFTGTHHGVTWAPQVRRCRDCHHPIGRQHRD